jgi:hypothetical protein
MPSDATVLCGLALLNLPPLTARMKAEEAMLLS